MKLEAVLQSLHLYTTDAILITDSETSDRPGHLIVYANEAFEEQTGHSIEEIIGQSPSIFQGPNSDRGTIRRMSESLRLWKPVREEILNYRKDGTEFWVDLSIGPVADESGWVHYWVSIQRDITEKKNTENLLEQQKAQLDLQKEELKRTNQQLKISEYRLIEAQRIAKLGSWYLDLKTNEVIWTKALYDIYGFDCTLPPPPFTEHERLFTPKSWNKLEKAVAHTIESGKPYDLDLQTVNADGVLGWMRVHGEVVIDEESGIEKVALQGTAQDITEQKNAENKLRELALSDPLTGVANRTAFNNHVGHNINVHERQGGQSTLVLLDLDDFKMINDRYGHAAGDAVLKSVASVLSRHTRKTDIVARLGGDEFALFFSNVSDSFNKNKKISKIINEIEEKIEFDGHIIKVAVSAGIASYPHDADSADELLKRADLALYLAKKTKGSAFEVFAPGMAFSRGKIL